MSYEEKLILWIANGSVLFICIGVAILIWCLAVGKEKRCSVKAQPTIYHEGEPINILDIFLNQE